MDTLTKIKLIKFVNDNGHCWIEFDKVRKYKNFHKSINLNKHYKFCPTNPNSSTYENNCKVHVYVAPLTLKVKVIKITKHAITVDPKESDLILPDKVNAVLGFKNKEDRQFYEGYNLYLTRHHFNGMDNVKLLGVNKNGK